ncbi:DUF881 domain-containing protein [Lutibacter sp. B2]|nr:DUF881 domain-containing protein [Lutibacter sp. B2]
MKYSIWKFNILIIAILLGVLISLQFKNVKDIYSYVPLKVIHEYKVSIESEKKEVDNLKEIIRERNQRILAYEKIKEKDGKFKDAISVELKKQKMIAGFSDLEGPGIILTLDDSKRELYEGEDPNDILVHDIYVLMLINDLKEAGAEAISINGQRLLASSELSCAGHSVRINDQFFAQPFIIKAIGAPKVLEAALIAPEANGTFLKEYYDLYVEVNIASYINIPRYSEKINIRYSKSLEEGE